MGCSTSRAAEAQALQPAPAGAPATEGSELKPFLLQELPLPPLDEEQLARASGLMRKALFVTDRPSNIGDLYEWGAPLGEGAFGSVHQAQSKSGSTPVAIKSISKSQKANFERGIKKIKMEISVLELMHHPNVVELREVFEDRQVVYLVMELCAGRSLHGLLTSCRTLSEPHAAILTRQVLAAVRYMHGLSVCHRDLKPDNLLFQADGAVPETLLKVSDFGLSWRFGGGEEMRERVGTATYAAPQVMRGRYSHLCDLWSCGVILYEMLCGAAPYRAETEAQLLDAVHDGKLSLDGCANWASASAAARGLVASLLALDPSERCTAEQALRHEWIAMGGAGGGAAAEAADEAAAGSGRSLWKLLFDGQGVCGCQAGPNSGEGFMGLSTVASAIDRTNPPTPRAYKRGEEYQ